MPGRRQDNPAISQAQEIEQKKRDFLSFFQKLPSKKAAADFINRSVDTVEVWIKNDEEFSAAYHRAKADWALKNHKRVRPDNFLANLYPDDFRPLKQEVDAKVTLNDVRNPDALEQLLAQRGFVRATGPRDPDAE